MAEHEPKDKDLWMVLAIIQEFRLDSVTLSLERLPGFGGMTVSDCRGFGQEHLHEARTAGDPHASHDVVDFTRKVKLEIAVAGQGAADAVVDAISRTARTGRRGDGKIFAWQLARALRVRTLEVGRQALDASPVASAD